MSQHEERARAILKVRKLIDQTTDRGRTEHEADLAMSQLSKLMTVYNITMTEALLAGESCKKVECSTFTTTRGPLSEIAWHIANFTDTKHWFHRQRGALMYSKRDPSKVLRDTNGSRLRHPGDTKFNFYGLEEDADMAAYLFKTIRESMLYETAQFKKSDYYVNYDGYAHKRVVTLNFQEGFIQRVGMRLDELKEESAKEVKAAQTTGTDLVLMKRQKVEDDFKKHMGLHLRSSEGRTGGSYDSSARAAGGKAGESVNLSRPISTGNNSSTRLIGGR